jgi:hypothetical protein
VHYCAASEAALREARDLLTALSDAKHTAEKRAGDAEAMLQANPLPEP